MAECQNKEPHDWTLCVFAHPGEKARRRDPAVYKYVATACPDFRKVSCSQYPTCPELSCIDSLPSLLGVHKVGGSIGYNTADEIRVPHAGNMQAW